MFADQDYNYTEIVNGAILYGICYWLGIPKDQAVELASNILTTELKLQGLEDEEISSKLRKDLSKSTKLVS